MIKVLVFLFKEIFLFYRTISTCVSQETKIQTPKWLNLAAFITYLYAYYFQGLL